jgi:hypothetical protein
LSHVEIKKRRNCFIINLQVNASIPTCIPTYIQKYSLMLLTCSLIYSMEDFPWDLYSATESALEFQILNHFTQVLQGDVI